jgi:quinolinate synthase
MTKTLIAAAVLAVVVVPAAAEATKVPEQFLGSWCSAHVAEEDIYKRSGVCNAHEPEEHLTFTADRL